MKSGPHLKKRSSCSGVGVLGKRVGKSRPKSQKKLISPGTVERQWLTYPIKTETEQEKGQGRIDAPSSKTKKGRFADNVSSFDTD